MQRVNMFVDQTNPTPLYFCSLVATLFLLSPSSLGLWGVHMRRAVGNTMAATENKEKGDNNANRSCNKLMLASTRTWHSLVGLLYRPREKK
jgi:hypothetical protein